MSKDNSKKKTIKLLPKSIGLKIVLFVELIIALAFLVLLTLMDAFPKKYTAIMLGMMFMLIIVSWIMMAYRGRQKAVRIFGTAMASIMIIMYGAISYYLGNTFAMFARISTSNTKSSNVKVTEEPFSVCISGIDNWGEDGGIDTFGRSDVNMIVTVNPVTRKILLTSTPRDSYVTFSSLGAKDKLTHTGIYGIEETMDTVSEWMDVDFDFYLKVNFQTLVSLIDAIGGIEVQNDYEFNSWIREDLVYEKGTIHLDGMRALYFARERKNLGVTTGDAERILNQQKVIKATLNKVMSSKTILLHYNDMLKAMGGNMETNMSTKEMSALVKMQLEDLGTWTIEQQATTGTTGRAPCASMGGRELSVFYVDEDSVEACSAKIQEVMNPSEEEIQAAKEYREKRAKENKLNNQKKSFKDFFNMK